MNKLSERLNRKRIFQGIFKSQETASKSVTNQWALNVNMYLGQLLVDKNHADYKVMKP